MSNENSASLCDGLKQKSNKSEEDVECQLLNVLDDLNMENEVKNEN